MTLLLLCPMHGIGLLLRSPEGEADPCSVPGHGPSPRHGCQGHGTQSCQPGLPSATSPGQQPPVLKTTADLKLTSLLLPQPELLRHTVWTLGPVSVNCHQAAAA